MLQEVSITDIGEKIDIVDIFRKSEDLPAVIDDVINRKKNDVKVIWMQEGIYNEEAGKRAKGNMEVWMLSIIDV